MQQLISDLTKQIQTGVLRPGEYLPSAHTLAKQYGIGYVSVIRAYKTLREAGLVDTVQGRGAFVRDTSTVAVLEEIVVVLPTQDTISHVRNPHSDWVFQSLLAGMNSATLAHGLRLQLLFDDVVQQQRASLIDQMGQGTGVIFVWQAPPPWVLRLQRHGIPYALVMPSHIGEWEREVPHVYADYEDGVYRAVSHYLRAGRRRTAFLGLPDDIHEGTRHAGYARAVAMHGGEEVACLNCLPISREGGYQVMHDYLTAHPDFSCDLFVAGNDLRALGALEAFREHNIDAPEKVVIVGFDDIQEAAEAGISTVHLPIREIGEQSVRWFVEQVVAKNEDVPVLRYPCEPVLR